MRYLLRMAKTLPRDLLLTVLIGLSLILITGCATLSPPTPPVVVSPPALPLPPQVKEPLILGSYWQKLSDLTTKRCNLRQSLQKLLNQPVQTCERS